MAEHQARDPAFGEPETGWLLARASHALATAVAAEVRREGLALRGYVVLQLAVQRPLPQQTLASSLGLDKTTMVAAVDELEDAGRTALARARSVVARTEDDLLADLGDDRAVLHRLLLTALQGRLGAVPPGGSCV